MGKPTICIGKNKDADQLLSNCEADQRLCICHTDSTILLLLIPNVSSFKLYAVTVQVSSVCVTPGRNPKLLVLSRKGSYVSRSS